MIAMAILTVIGGTIAYTYHARLQRAAEGNGGQSANAIGVLNGVPEGGYIPPQAPLNIPIPLPPPAAPSAPAPEPEKPNPYRAAWELYFQHMEKLRQAREQVALAAIDAPSAVPGAAKRPPAAETAATPSGMSPAEQFTKYAMDRLNQTTGQNTLNARREPPVTPYELRAGAVIPAVMIGGVNSDLPGQLLAQVSGNVYDTATGRLILIPQGSKLLGTYDSGVTTGQERVLVAWTRIIFPDGSALDLGRMPGASEDGYAGLHDQVNNHFWKIWSNALLLSAFSAGIQLSQGNGNNQSSNLNATQTIAASTGQQMGQLGMEIARRNLQIQPTLDVRPGYRFVVQVTKDVILRRWQPTDKTTAFVSGYPYRDGVQQ
jgi:type IV secretion system protein VirB10